MTLSSSMPSWVPDWADNSMHAAPLRGDRDLSGDRGAGYLATPYRATGDSARPVIDGVRDGRLCLKGYVYDTIAEVGSVKFVAEDQRQTQYETMLRHHSNKDSAAMLASATNVLQQVTSGIPVFREWERLAHLGNSDVAYPTGEDMISVYRQTLMTCQDAEGLRFPGERFEAWRKFLKDVVNSLDDPVSYENPSSQAGRKTLTAAQASILSSIRKYRASSRDSGSLVVPIEPTLYRSMVRATKGYLALAPAATKLGDEVALLAGGRAPYVVRPDGGDWKLVGTAYVHGIMYGEVWDPSQCHDMTFA